MYQSLMTLGRIFAYINNHSISIIVFDLTNTDFSEKTLLKNIGGNYNMIYFI